jgi:hypothetical protein
MKLSASLEKEPTVSFTKPSIKKLENLVNNVQKLYKTQKFLNIIILACSCDKEIQGVG